MWHVEENKGSFALKVGLKIGETKHHQHLAFLPKGEEGQEEQGFLIYEIVEVEEKGGEKKTVLNYITCNMGQKPALIVLNAHQFKSWQKANLIAKPAKFVWKP